MTYDLHDNLVMVTDASGELSYTYDAVKRVTSRRDTEGFLVQYEYDPAGRVTALIYPDGKRVTYTYDHAGHLTEVTDWLGQTATYSHGLDGKTTSLNTFNGIETTYARNVLGRVTAQETRSDDDTLLNGYTLTLDARGQRVAIEREGELEPVLPNDTSTYSYDERQRITSDGAKSYDSDASGNLIKAGESRTLSFDQQGRLTSVTGDVDLSLSFDNDGNRIRRVLDGIERRYVYDISGRLLAEVDQDGDIARYYIYGQGLLSSVDHAGKAHCYHFDPSGNTVALTDAEQQVVNRYAYTPFGQLANAMERLPQPFTYAGKHGVEQELEGLYRMGSRYYDADIGRFISEDPSGFSSGHFNLYLYVNNNPISFSDPSGLWVFGVKLEIDILGLVTLNITAAIDDDFDTAVTVGASTSVGTSAKLFGVPSSTSSLDASANGFVDFYGDIKTDSEGTTTISTSAGVTVSGGAGIYRGSVSFDQRGVTGLSFGVGIPTTPKLTVKASTSVGVTYTVFAKSLAGGSAGGK
jgi:RHS repeat-associated protein